MDIPYFLLTYLIPSAMCLILTLACFSHAVLTCLLLHPELPALPSLPGSGIQLCQALSCLLAKVQHAFAWFFTDFSIPGDSASFEPTFSLHAAPHSHTPWCCSGGTREAPSSTLVSFDYILLTILSKASGTPKIQAKHCAAWNQPVHSSVLLIL